MLYVLEVGRFARFEFDVEAAASSNASSQFDTAIPRAPPFFKQVILGRPDPIRSTDLVTFALLSVTSFLFSCCCSAVTETGPFPSSGQRGPPPEIDPFLLVFSLFCPRFF